MDSRSTRMGRLCRTPFLLTHAIAILTLRLPASTLSSTTEFSPPSPALPTSGNATDRLALLAFKFTVGDPSGALASWNDSLPFCSWRGVACGRRHPQRVVALRLGGLGLDGPVPPPLSNLTFLRRLHLGDNTFRGRIPPELGRLFRLQYLNLSLNSITGEIPPELGRLFRLQYLNLSSNSITGEIPTNLSHCTSLRTLALWSNEIEGKIPGWVGSLPQLIILDLSQNHLTGPIPPSLANLSTSLRALILFENDLVGNIPVELGRMANLFFLDVDFNRLSGRLPPSFYNLSFLTWLHVGRNQLSGTLPPDIGQALPRLQNLLFYENLFHGPIPSSFPNATELRQLDLSENQFGGAIPPNLGGLPHLSFLVLPYNRLEGGEVDDWAFLTSLTNCSHMRRLQVQGNNIRGALPTSAANLSKELEVLTMGWNNLSGRIPPGIGNLISLTALSAPVCQLSGDIPETVGSLQALRWLTLYSNDLSGQIPLALGNLTLLTYLRLNVNELRGSIPTSFQYLSALTLLDLSYNELSGNIPRELVGLSSLSLYLNLSHNSLSGSLPTEVGSLKNLVELDVSENRLFGEIPSSVGECQVLQFLHMQGNLFQGTIPPSLNSRALMVMDLSRNNLSGPIPKFLAGMQLQLLNLSFNSFQGQVPSEGVFRNLSSISIAGNRGLCGGDPLLKLPDCPVLQTPRSRRRHMPKALVTVVVAVPALCLITLCYLFGKRCWKHHPSHKSSPPAASPFDHYEKVSYGELLKATGGFSPENVLGVGSFGSVYKGVLGPEEKAVAVKVLDLGRHGASKSFTAECQALRNVRHRNLAKVLTSCCGIDFKGDDFKAMVFEFMENGSLEEWLHPGTTSRSDQPRNLSVVQRLNVAVDVASALDYLHNHARPPIVHCDLKPSNVLLDSHLCGKVGDFGLARLLGLEHGKEGSQVLTSSIGIKGSIGYIAPEYGMGGQISTLGDVYSYGILLLEMFTGKRPTEGTFQDGLSLHKYVEMAFPEHVMEVMDHCMVVEEEDEAANGNGGNMNDVGGRLKNCLMSVLEIGLLCSKESPKERMDMKHVAEEILKARDVCLGVGFHGRMLNGGGAGHHGASSSGH